MPWVQVYDPFNNQFLSTLAAALPILVLLGLLGIFQVKAQWAALAGLVTAVLVAIIAFGMPVLNSVSSAGYGGAQGLLPIGWIVLAAVFLYNLTVETGQFEIVKNSIASLSPDRRIQALLIAFSFGAFIEGAAGFGTPVAISAALLLGLGFPPLYAAGLSLIANTAPVAFGAIGTPILTLGTVTGLNPVTLGQMAGRQLPFVSVIIPIWLVVTMSGWKGFRDVWHITLISGVSFAIVQFLWSNAIGPELTDITAGVFSLLTTAVAARYLKPKEVFEFTARQQEKAAAVLAKVGARGGAAGNGGGRIADRGIPDVAGHDVGPGGITLGATPATAHARYTRGQLARAWTPWVILSVFVFIWGLPLTKAFFNGGTSGVSTYQTTNTKLLDGSALGLATYITKGKALPAAKNNGVTAPNITWPGLDHLVFRQAPVAPAKVDESQINDTAYQKKNGEAAVYTFSWLSATGTSILFAAIATAIFLGIGPGRFVRVFLRTLNQMKWPLFTIFCMLALGNVTRYGGTDATLGLAFTKTGVVYPFFAALLGWLGVALTGSDTSSNTIFGSLQKITAQQLGLNPVLITTANSTGGVMGKMVDAQSITVSTAATKQAGQEGAILRFVFLHSIALACIMGAIVLLQAYVLTWMIPT